MDRKEKVDTSYFGVPLIKRRVQRRDKMSHCNRLNDFNINHDGRTIETPTT